MKAFFLFLFFAFSALYAEQFYYANAPVVEVYDEHDLMGEVGTRIGYGTPVEVLEVIDGWYFIKTPDAYEGWVEKR